MKCKNIECENETEGKKVYCSLKCRNVYVNKYLRDYKKTSDGFKRVRENKIQLYYENPKKCKTCDKIIKCEKKENDFCDNSCSASFNNKGRKHKEESKNKLRKTALEKDLYLNFFKNKNYSIVNNNIKKYHTEQRKKYYENPNICKNCDEIIKYENKKNKQYCSRNCRHEHERRVLTEKQKYKLDCKFKFNLNDYKSEFDFMLIEKYGWYKAKNRGDNLKGVSRDHMFSITEGFENNVDSKIIAHPANCKLMRHEENSKKNTKSSITLEDLKNRIRVWENKYGFYYEYDILE
jgi:hypothetical protein